MASVESGDNPGPIVDGELVPTNIDRAFAEGKQAPVPWMIGSNNYEASLFPAMLADPDGTVLAQVPVEARPMFMALFDPDKTGDKRTVVANVLTDKVFAEPARYLAARQNALGQPTYRYVFAYVPEQQRTELPGAGHGAEIQFVFGTLGTFLRVPRAAIRRWTGRSPPTWAATGPTSPRREIPMASVSLLGLRIRPIRCC